MNTFVLAAGMAATSTAAIAATVDRCRTRRALARAVHAATHDGLTGLLNRVGLAAAWVHHAGTGAGVAVLDLDGFKPVNDTHGHAAGDQVLTSIAARLAGWPGVTAARLGGDEFALLLPGPGPTDADPTGVDPAARLAGLAARIAEPIALSSGAVVVVTASIGLAAGGADLSLGLADADAAMYRAKTTRAGIAVYDPDRDDHPTTARPAARVRDFDHQPIPMGLTLAGTP